MTSRHYTGTVLPKGVVTVQEQRPNVGTTRTLLLHDISSPTKQGQFSVWREKTDKSCPTHPTVLTFGCFPLWELALLEICFVVANLRPRKSGEFTTWCHTPFGVPQRLPEMAVFKATVTWGVVPKSTECYRDVNLILCLWCGVNRRKNKILIDWLTLCGQQRRVLWKSLKMSLLQVFLFWSHGITYRTSGLLLVSVLHLTVLLQLARTCVFKKKMQAWF